jgi:hypothetical protein
VSLAHKKVLPDWNVYRCDVSVQVDTTAICRSSIGNVWRLVLERIAMLQEQRNAICFQAFNLTAMHT